VADRAISDRVVRDAASPDRERVQAAEVIASLSLATDLGSTEQRTT